MDKIKTFKSSVIRLGPNFMKPKLLF